MLSDSLARHRLARRAGDPAVPGDTGDDVLVTCDRSGDGRYEALAGIRSAYLYLPGQPHPAAASGVRSDWHRAVAAADGGTVRLCGEGVFRNIQIRHRLSTVLGRAVCWRWRLHIPQAGTLEGAFKVSVLRAAGGAGKAWDFELGSLGPLSFRAR